MDFTILFVRLFFWAIFLVGPLLFFLATLIVILGFVVSRKEKWPVFDGLYWAFITATTVGYGDIRPLQKASRVLSVLIAMIGMILSGIIIAVALNSTTLALDKHGNPQVLEKMKEKFEIE